jgi:hypothetical protein
VAISSLDALDILRRLQSVGFSNAQAEAIIEIIRDARSAHLASVANKVSIERLEATIKAGFQRLEYRMEIVERDITIHVGGMIAAMTGVLLAAKFFG